MASQYKLKISNEILELIRHLHPDIRQKVRAALVNIVRNPSCGKSLRGELTGMKSFRINKLRIIYRLTEDVIEIITVGPRRSIYEETLRLIKKEQ